MEKMLHGDRNQWGCCLRFLFFLFILNLLTLWAFHIVSPDIITVSVPLLQISWIYSEYSLFAPLSVDKANKVIVYDHAYFYWYLAI